MKTLLISFLLLNTAILCQPGKNKRGDNFFNPQQLKPSIVVLPGSGSDISLSYLYRIPYNNLIFERNENSFNSSVRILVEIYRNDELLKREFVDEKVSVDNFDIVKSKSVAVQGSIHFSLEAGEYIIKGNVTDLNSQKELTFRTIRLDGEKSFRSGIFNPIVIKPVLINCAGYSLPLIVNQGGTVPYSSEIFHLLIPVADTTIENLSVEITNNADKDSVVEVTESFIDNIDPMECSGKILLGSGKVSFPTKNFILRDINKNLLEGRINVIVNADEKPDMNEFQLFVDWENKPLSLRKPEFAIEMLSYIEVDSVVSAMLDYEEEEYPQAIHNYWKQFDPTPDTEFNELMEEFYSRIDFAAMEFRGIGKRNGLSTDRGKVYIKNGKPDSIERTSNELGYVVEIWTYTNTQKIFQFVDKQGTGNFILIEG